ncbi:hypothetical protein HDU97_006970 [Phlyctochytrium planicorne]|nr:hypothetical protein HDU97_006970 [Phlyctochytrium planicorne]
MQCMQVGRRLFSSAARAAFTAPENFVGSVGAYKQHVVIVSDHDRWPKSIADDEFVARVIGTLSRIPDLKFNSSNDSIGKLQSADVRDILVYPDMVRMRNISSTDLKEVANIIQRTRNMGKSDSPDKSSVISETLSDEVHIMVCTHGNVDHRCGKCGNELHATLRDEIDRRGLSSKVKVQKTSHIGGHAFAANAIVYPSSDWYGFLQKEDVPRLLDAIVRKNVYWEKWRGRPSLTKEEQLQVYTENTKDGKASKNIPQQLQRTISIRIITEKGDEKIVETPLGKRILDVCKENGISGVEGVCGGNLECATCHMYVDNDYLKALPAPSEAELDMLEYAVGRNDRSVMAAFGCN